MKLKINKSLVKWVAGIMLGGVLSGGLSFYLLIVLGIAPIVQEIWVTTAMTTLNHKWLATAFIDEKIIEDIMEKTRVHDENFFTDNSALEIAVVNIENNQTSEKDLNEQKDKYLAESYELLEEGIYLKEVSGGGWKGYLLLVTDPSRVSLGQTRYQFSRGDLIKTLVPFYEAKVGINAGGFVDGPNYDSNGGTPAGLLIIDGQVINSQGNSKHSVIGFNTDNKLILGKMTRQEAIDLHIRDAVDFKPFLIVNGETVIKEGQGGWGIAPRTAIGQRITGEVLFLCVDGRQAHSLGCDLKPIQDIMEAEGCINAAMLDGGSSTVMYHIERGYLNKPSLGHERYINNCWLIK
jgi:exopolysaccharide biosynthesis protein